MGDENNNMGKFVKKAVEIEDSRSEVVHRKDEVAEGMNGEEITLDEKF